jgi:hypothetical protein
MGQNGTWTFESTFGISLEEFSAISAKAERRLFKQALSDADLSSLITLSDIDKIVTSQNLVFPMVRISKDGAMLPPHQFTKASGLEVDAIRYVDSLKLFRCFRDGGTIVFRDMHRYWPPITELSWELSRELGCAVTVNAYLTPRDTQGLTPHFDYHDLLLVQVAGTKSWYSYSHNADLPLDNNNWRSIIRSVTTPPPPRDTPIAETTQLDVGDVLFVPRGSSHAARTSSEVSLHLALELQTWTSFDVTLGVLRQVSSSRKLRTGVPYEITADRTLTRDVVGESIRDVRDLADDLDINRLGWAIYRDSHVDLFETPIRLVSQYSSIASIEDSATFARRKRILFAVRMEQDYVVVEVPDRVFRFPRVLASAVELALSGEDVSIAACETAGTPGEATRRMFRSLVSEGILVPSPATGI